MTGTPMGKAEFAVHHNEPAKQYVMAYTCFCGILSVAFGDASHDMFTGKCENGHEVVVDAGSG
jgi:hypothetical protein